MAIMLELELTLGDTEKHDDIYAAREVLEKLLSDFGEAASKVDIEVEAIRMSTDDGEEFYNIEDGWDTMRPRYPNG